LDSRLLLLLFLLLLLLVVLKLHITCLQQKISKLLRSMHV